MSGLSAPAFVEALGAGLIICSIVCAFILMIAAAVLVIEVVCDLYAFCRRLRRRE